MLAAKPNPPGLACVARHPARSRGSAITAWGREGPPRRVSSSSRGQGPLAVSSLSRLQQKG